MVPKLAFSPLASEAAMLSANSNPQVYKDSFRVDRSGEVFLYVNDVVIGLPWLYDWFYVGHQGKAKVTIRLL